MKISKKYFLMSITILGLNINSNYLKAQLKSDIDKISNKELPKAKVSNIKQKTFEKFVQVPSQLPGLSKETSDKLIKKVNDIWQEEGHRQNIGKIVVKEKLNKEDIEKLINHIKKEKELVRSKIQRIVQHVNQSIEKELKEHLSDTVSEVELNATIESLKLDPEEEINKELHEHDNLIEQIEEILEDLSKEYSNKNYLSTHNKESDKLNDFDYLD
ncbi:hypothetical protein [Candidatus Babela massiliensis]|uniref:Uncharacterized protein n=1 Tax=Candidatus Babela massiliensis TaxID=673862 RepID=V6DI74_9BACT|nr:hypothetical protein [Candidatus Babela massiliensis]CDK30231.1 hypothetical protein BABL1_gene_925 [Candidatus Babela massiliensis]